MTRIYANQKVRSKSRSHSLPSYSKKQLHAWVINQHNFNELYNNWIMSGYDKYKTPSVDRKDDYKSYTLDNIRLITWKENDVKGSKDRTNGINNKLSKAVSQYGLNGNFIEEYYSMNKAGRETGVNQGGISNVCNNIEKTAGEFIWKYSVNINK